MNPANRKVLALLALALSMAWSTTHIRAETATELIERAHQYDNMYTLSPEASQQKALGLYESALKAEPDDQRREHHDPYLLDNYHCQEGKGRINRWATAVRGRRPGAPGLAHGYCL